MPTMDLKFFANEPNIVEFGTGETVFSEGETADFMYGVVEGELEIVYRNHPLDVIHQGDILGEMALVEDQPRSASAVARTPVKLAHIDRKRFEYMVQNTPFFALQVMGVMARRLRRANQILSETPAALP